MSIPQADKIEPVSVCGFDPSPTLGVVATKEPIDRLRIESGA